MSAPSQTPPRHARAAVALAVGILAAAYASYLARTLPGFQTDFDQIWVGARAILGGKNPYLDVGPGRAFPWDYPLYYPMPAPLLAVPLGTVHLWTARALFIGSTSALLAWLLTRDGWERMPLFASMAFVQCIVLVQWTPLLMAATLAPSLGGLLVVKPNLGLALGAARLTDPRGLSRRALLATLAVATALVAASFVVLPTWPADWRAALRTGEHFTAPVRRLGGFVLLLALFRWRRPEARLLLALACTPQTPIVVEGLPLFLVAKTTRQSLWLAVLTYVAYVVCGLTWDGHTRTSYFRQAGIASVAFLYAPCLLMVLRRPNEGPVPAWLDRLTQRARVPGPA
ncbi:MAG: hypothetical protein ACJ79S_07070 [Gemmatimonadaceae bacterium]